MGDADWMADFVLPVLAGLVVAVTLAALAFSNKRVRAWWKAQRAAWRRSAQASRTQSVAVMRQQVVDVARARDIVLPMTLSGTNPSRVVFTDGEVSWFYRDHQSYSRGMASGQVNPLRTFRRTAPSPVSQWSDERLRQWLKDHAD